MESLETLQKQFDIPGSVRIEAGRGGLPRISVTADKASAEIYLHGAHVTRFQPRGGDPVLFMSESSFFKSDKPIRGGIPLIFPWFGPRVGDPQAPMHGFVRLRAWSIESIDRRHDGSVRVVLVLGSDAETLALWPHAFSLRLTVVVADSLDVALEVKNLSPQPITFEDAMHTYLEVGDIRRASLEGLEGVEYFDKADGMKQKKQPSEPVRIMGETDRVYLDTKATCTLHDPVKNRAIVVEKEGSDATVVWNPWIEKARAMADFGDDEWVRMICVETVNAMQHAVTLPAGHTHRMFARIAVTN